jgi:hypothetical protein
MRKAGMFTTMRVSWGIAFGPGSIVGSTFSAGWFSGGAVCVCASAVVIGETGDDDPRWHETVVNALRIATITNLPGDFIQEDLTLFRAV